MINPTHCRVLVAEPLGREGLELLEAETQVDVRVKHSPEALKAILPGYHALIVRSATKVTADLIEAGKQLVVIGRAGVGVDNIDVAAATRGGILIVNAPTSNIVAAAEHAMALMFAVARQIPQADRSLRAGEWKREQFTGVELAGKQLGLVGLGRVGSEVARRARGLGMEVAVFDPYISEERVAQLGVRSLALDELLATSDFVSLHTPATPETRGLMNAARFGQMKPGARLINAARGALIDETALLDALDAGTLAGAALDVFEPEPPRDPRLLAHPALVVTPHIGGSTVESAARVSIQIAEEVIAALAGRPTRFAVNAPFVPPSLAAVLVPYLDLAERLGRFYLQWAGGPLGRLEIEYSGMPAQEDTSILSAAIIQGLLGPIHTQRVNLVNARAVAREHGVILSERRSREEAGENRITLIGRQRVAGAVIAGRPHIVGLDDYRVDCLAEGYLLLTRHRDRPGMIGKVGTLLGQADVNIGAMVVARDVPRGEAIMVLAIDDPLPAAALDELRLDSAVQWAKVIHL